MTPHLKRENFEERLYSDWKEHGTLIVAVDFDDTVFPYSGKGDFEEIFAVLKECQENEFYIVIFTASKAERFPFIKEYMAQRGINIHAINKNAIPMEYGNDGKIYYNILLDDKAGLDSSYIALRMVLLSIRNEKQILS